MVILCITYGDSIVQGFDSFSPWGLGFDHTVIHVRFGEEKVALGQIFSMLWFSVLTKYSVSAPYLFSYHPENE